jgi:hypothetical protein
MNARLANMGRRRAQFEESVIRKSPLGLAGVDLFIKRSSLIGKNANAFLNNSLQMPYQGRSESSNPFELPALFYWEWRISGNIG